MRNVIYDNVTPVKPYCLIGITYKSLYPSNLNLELNTKSLLWKRVFVELVKNLTG